MNREIREAIRYLGYGRHAIDEQTLALVECSMEELKAKVRERFIYRIFELSQKDGVLQIGDWTIEVKVFPELKKAVAVWRPLRPLWGRKRIR